MDERVFLNYDDAVAMLPDEDTVHTFVNAPFGLLGADWSREDILELLKSGKPELSGKMATNMDHGIIAWRGGGKGEAVFIETKKKEKKNE